MPSKPDSLQQYLRDEENPIPKIDSDDAHALDQSLDQRDVISHESARYARYIASIKAPKTGMTMGGTNQAFHCRTLR